MPKNLFARAATLVAWLAVAPAFAPAQVAQAQDANFTACLDQPGATDDIVRQCTAVIESANASPLDKALAYNNRAVMADKGQVADMNEAVKLAPKIAKLWHNLGRQRLAVMQEGDPRAMEEFSSAIQMDPRYAVAWTSRGELWQTMGRHDRAIPDFDEAIRLAPRFMHPMYNPYESRARALEARGDLGGADIDRRLTKSVMGAGKSEPPGPNTSGLRQWEPFISRQQVPKELQ